MTDGGDDKPPRGKRSEIGEPPQFMRKPGDPPAPKPKKQTLEPFEVPPPVRREPSVPVVTPPVEAPAAAAPVEAPVAVEPPAAPVAAVPAAPIEPMLTAPVATDAIVVAATPPDRTTSGSIVMPSEPLPPPASDPFTAAFPGAELPKATKAEQKAAAKAAAKEAKARAKEQAALRALDDDSASDDGEPKSRKLVVVAATSVAIGLGIAATIFIGKNNASKLYLTCNAKQVVAEQGRAFPPWGERVLLGDEWRPIDIPADFICMDAEVESTKELGNLFRAKLVERADAMLMAGNGADVDKAAGMLEQALLHARTDDPDHKVARDDIKQRLGDVGYWRATAKLREASAALEEAAKQFDAAALQRPRYVKDSSKWAELIRRLGKELAAGPAGVTITPEVVPVAPTPDRPSAPPGIALPVEPDGSGSSAGSAEPPPAPTPPPDAGVPTGGVLL